MFLPLAPRPAHDDAASPGTPCPGPGPRPARLPPTPAANDASPPRGWRHREYARNPDLPSHLRVR